MSIDSVSFNFHQLKLLAEGNVDILFVTDSNTDESFPTNLLTVLQNHLDWIETEMLVEPFYKFTKIFLVNP